MRRVTFPTLLGTHLVVSVSSTPVQEPTMGKIRKRPASVLEAADDSLPTKGLFPTTTSDTTKPHPVSLEVKGATPSNNDANGIRFGKHLASSDKEVRDRTVASLREWLRKRSASGSLTDLDLMKVTDYSLEYDTGLDAWFHETCCMEETKPRHVSRAGPEVAVGTF